MDKLDKKERTVDRTKNKKMGDVGLGVWGSVGRRKRE